MITSENIGAISQAIAKAQMEVENASKNSANPHFKSRYADLAELLNTVRPVFSAHGLAIVQAPSFESGVANVETMISHSSGEWIKSVCSAPVGKQDAQGVGSAITYLRRYSLAAMCGIAQEDDDANSAVGHRPQQATATSAPKQKQKLDDTRFKSACDAVEAGKFSKEKLLTEYDLTQEQRNAAAAL